MKSVSSLVVSVFTLATLVSVTLLGATPAQAQLSRYYIADGDSNRAFIVQNGALVTSFSTAGQFLGYPIAVRDTVWLGNRDNNGATEYDLNGVPTGNTSLGGATIGGDGQLVDGTTDGTFNYGVTFEGGNVITRAGLDWTNQAALFSVPNGETGKGITYDSLSGNLFVSTFSGNVYEMTLSGAVIDSFAPGGVDLRSLAYEAASDTLWVASGNTITQLDKNTGATLQSIIVSGGTNFGNNFGGEFALVGGPVAVPEPGTLMLILPLAVGVIARRKTVNR